MPYTYTHFVNVYRALGFEKESPNLCAGLAQMAVHAFLAGEAEYNIFIKRLEYIAGIRDITRLKEEIAETKKKIARQKSELKLSGDSEEQTHIDLLAFFECIELSLQPHLHTDLFGSPISQQRIDRIAPFIESNLLSKKIEDGGPGGVFTASSFPGIYTKKELQDIFDALNKITRAQRPPINLSLALSSINHRIALLYDHKKGKWGIVDVNQLPPYDVDDEKVAENLFMSLGKKLGEKNSTMIAFNTFILTTRRDEKSVAPVVTYLKPFADDQTAMSLRTPRKTDVLNVSLAHIAAKCGHCDIIKRIPVTELSEKTAEKLDSVTPLQIAAACGEDEIIESLIEKKVNLDEVSKDGDTAINIAARHGHAKAVKILLAAGADSNIANISGNYPLGYAIRYRHAEIVKILEPPAPTTTLEEEKKEGKEQKTTEGKEQKTTLLDEVNAFYNYLEIMFRNPRAYPDSSQEICNKVIRELIPALRNFLKYNEQAHHLADDDVAHLNKTFHDLKIEQIFEYMYDFFKTEGDITEINVLESAAAEDLRNPKCRDFITGTKISGDSLIRKIQTKIADRKKECEKSVTPHDPSRSSAFFSAIGKPADGKPAETAVTDVKKKKLD